MIGNHQVLEQRCFAMHAFAQEKRRFVVTFQQGGQMIDLGARNLQPSALWFPKSV